MTARVWRSDPAGTYVVRGDNEHVEAWSTVRLPFEPRDVMVDLRADLRAALMSLDVPDGRVLHAVYAAEDTGDFVDVENVLIYNVGTSTLRPLTRTGIRFERSYAGSPATDRLDRADRLHQHAYSAGAVDDGFTRWTFGDVVAELDDVPVPRIDKPAPVWAAIRSHCGPPPATAPEPFRFAARLTVTAPSGRQVAAASIIKPLLDGVICAFHSHVGPADEDLVTRVAVAGDLSDVGAAGRMLLDRRWSAFGSRQLVKPFGPRGVQWNPADDLCVAAQVVIEATPSPDRSLRVSGTLHRAVPSSPAHDGKHGDVSRLGAAHKS